jgi:carbamoyltransferase
MTQWRSVTQHHPSIGYTFIPGVKARVHLPNEEAAYLVRANAEGFRCDHEFVAEKREGTRRALLFGDSFTAGDGVSNGKRYGDLLEQLIEGLEVYNFGLPGTGTDQQYLAYQEYGARVEHDLLILAVTVENIGRVASRFRPYVDERGETVLYAKPYYVLERGRLALKNVPVSKEPIPKSELGEEESKHTDWGLPFAGLRRVARQLGLRDLAQKVTHFQPVPDYRTPDNPKWLVMRAILEEWIEKSRAPVILMPVPLFPFVEGSSDPTHYQTRFRELAEATACALHDPLPDLQSYPQPERRAFRFDRDVHLTPAGHAALAKSLAPVVERVLRGENISRGANTAG